MAVAGLGIMSPAAHATCGTGSYQGPGATGSTDTYAVLGAPVYSGGTAGASGANGNIGVGDATGFAQLSGSGDASGGSATLDAASDGSNGLPAGGIEESTSSP